MTYLKQVFNVFTSLLLSEDFQILYIPIVCLAILLACTYAILGFVNVRLN